MRILYLIFLLRASLQLKCDKTEITAHIGGEFILTCKFDTTNFLLSKKYWCRGNARESCEILVHSERVAKAEDKFIIIDLRSRGLFVKVSRLKFEDAGKYWVGIDKIFTDIMTSVNVIVTEVPVSKPTLWPLSSLVDRPTCWGQQVTVRCSCTKGTGIRYTWYQKNTQNEDHVLHSSSDLHLHCGAMEEDSEYFCIATNDISSQKSDRLSVQVLMHADSSCIYVIHMQGQPIYDCADRMSTTTIAPPPLTSCKATTFPPDISSQASHSQTNQTGQHFLFSTSWTGLPLWYTLLRWGSFASLLIVLGIALTYIKSQQNIKRARRKSRVHFRRMPYLAQ